MIFQIVQHIRNYLCGKKPKSISAKRKQKARLARAHKPFLSPQEGVPSASEDTTQSNKRCTSGSTNKILSFLSLSSMCSVVEAAATKAIEFQAEGRHYIAVNRDIYERWRFGNASFPYLEGILASSKCGVANVICTVLSEQYGNHLFQEHNILGYGCAGLAIPPTRTIYFFERNGKPTNASATISCLIDEINSLEICYLPTLIMRDIPIVILIVLLIHAIQAFITNYPQIKAKYFELKDIYEEYQKRAPERCLDAFEQGKIPSKVTFPIEELNPQQNFELGFYIYSHMSSKFRQSTLDSRFYSLRTRLSTSWEKRKEYIEKIAFRHLKAAEHYGVSEAGRLLRHIQNSRLNKGLDESLDNSQRECYQNRPSI